MAGASQKRIGVMIACGLLLLTACAPANKAVDAGDRAAEAAATNEPANTYPRDMTIDVTVLVGAGEMQPDRVEHRQGRYVLFPDGTLLADLGRSLRMDVRPGHVRRLRREQMAAIWSAARNVGLAPASPGEIPRDATMPGNDALLEAAPGQVMHVVDISADDSRWRFVRTAPFDAPTDPATTRLIRELAERAWFADEPAGTTAPAVIRYDFGPDPYASHRARREAEPAVGERTGESR